MGTRRPDDWIRADGPSEPRLLYLRARWTTAGPIITTADGEQLDNSTELSRWLDRPVVLTAAGAEGGTYENPLDVERDEDWVSWQGPGGAWHDNVDMQISLVTTRSLGTWEPQRFRINLIIRDEGQLDWGAATLRVGSATLVPSRPIERCVMVTRAQPGIARDLDVLRTIRKTTGTFGHGATIHQAGTITVGDHIS